MMYANTRANMHTFNNLKVLNVRVEWHRKAEGDTSMHFSINQLTDEGLVNSTLFEVHTLHDRPDNHTTDQDASPRAWLLANIDEAFLTRMINTAKEMYLTEPTLHHERIVSIEFDDPAYNYTRGVKDNVTLEMLEDFYLSNKFIRYTRPHNVRKVECKCIHLKTNKCK